MPAGEEDDPVSVSPSASWTPWKLASAWFGGSRLSGHPRSSSVGTPLAAIAVGSGARDAKYAFTSSGTSFVAAASRVNS